LAPLIDIRTLSLVSVVISAVIVMPFAVAALHFRRGNHAASWWSFGFLLHATGFLLLLLRGRIPDILSIPLANAFLVSGPVMFLWGIEIYAAVRPRFIFGLAWISISVGALIAVTYGQPDYSLRVCVLSTILLGINAVSGARLWRLRHVARLQRIVTACIFFASAAAMGLRGLVSLLVPVQGGLFAYSLSSAIGFFYAVLMPISVAIGFLSMISRQMQVAREKTIDDLGAALRKVKTLSGLLPICASCKKIRDDNGHWHQMELYVRDHSEADFSHSICPDCATRLYPNIISVESSDE
jgi:hypothetical protein